MATKKIEFELIVDTTNSDRSVVQSEKRILSLNSNLKDSVAKIEVFKKALETGGNKLPALDLLKQFKVELASASRAVNSLKESSEKSFLKNYISEAKATPLPSRVSGIVNPGQGSTSIGDISTKNLSSLEAAYKASVLKGQEAISKSLAKQLEQALKSSSLNLTQAGSTKITSDLISRLSNFQAEGKLSSSIPTRLTNYLKETDRLLAEKLQPKHITWADNMTKLMGQSATQRFTLPNAQALSLEEQQAALREKTKKIVESYKAFFKEKLVDLDSLILKHLPVNPYQSAIGRKQEEVTKANTPPKLSNIAQRATSIHADTLLNEEKLFNQYKALTPIQAKLAEIATLQKQLNTISPRGNLLELWTETSKRIHEAKLALEQYIKTENSLKFQKGLNDSVLPFGRKQLDLANSKVFTKDTNTARAEVENKQLLDTIQRRYNNLISRTAAKVDGTTTEEDRKALLARMSMLGQKAETSLGQAKTIADAKLLTAAYKDQLAILKEQSLKDTEIQQKSKDIVSAIHTIQGAGLSSSNTQKYIRELLEARNTLTEIDMLQRKQRQYDTRNSRALSYGGNALNTLEQQQQLRIVESKYGNTSLRAIDLNEQQQLEALRAKASRKISAANSSLPGNASPSELQNHKKIIDAISSAYVRQSDAVRNSSQAMRDQSAAIQAQLHASTNLLVKISEYVIGYRLVNSVVEKTIGFFKNIPDVGVKFENAKAVFQAMFVTTKSVNEQFTFLDAVADRTGARIRSLRTEFGDFSASALAAGESVINVQQSMADLSDVATVMHLPEERIHSALVAVSQMYAKNQVMSEELKRQLGNTLPGAVAMFARSQGLSTKELLDQMKAGLVKPKDTVPQFLAFYKSVFAPQNAFETASQGYYANLGRMENEYIRLSESIYKKFSSNLIGGVKVGTDALKTLRENLDGILLVLKDIGIVGGAVLGIAALKSAERGIAGLALASSIRGGRALPNPAIARPATLNATNPAHLAMFTTAGGNLPQFIANIKPIVLEAWQRFSPLVTKAVSALVAYEVIADRLKNTKINLGENLDASALEVFSLELGKVGEAYSAWVKWAEKPLLLQIGLDSSSSSYKALQKLLDNLDYLNPASNAERFKGLVLQGTGQALDLFTPQSTKDELKAQKLAERQKQQTQTQLEEMQQATQKMLLAEPVHAVESLLEGKNFTRTIDIVGKAVTTQINAISQRANIEIQRLEQRTSNLDRKVQLGLLSYGEARDQKLAVIDQKAQIQTEVLNKERQYQSIQQGLIKQFSEGNTKLQVLASNVASATDATFKDKQIVSGQQELNVRNKQTGQVEPQTITGLGYFINEDPAYGHVPDVNERIAELTKVEKQRGIYAQLLAESKASADETGKIVDLNPGITTNPWLGLPASVSSSAIKTDNEKLANAIKLNTEALEQQTKLFQTLGEETIKIDQGIGKPLSDEEIIYSFQRIAQGGDGTSSAETAKNVQVTMQRLGESLNALIDKESAKQGVPADFIRSLVTAESKGNRYAVSPTGNKGLMQLGAGVIKDYGVTDVFNPEQNLTAGIAYAGDLYHKFSNTKGDLTKVAAGFNAGQNNAALTAGKMDKLPPETKNYMKIVGENFKVINSFGENLSNLAKLPLKDQVVQAQSFSKGFQTAQAMKDIDLRQESSLAARSDSKAMIWDNQTLDALQAERDKRLEIANLTQSLKPLSRVDYEASLREAIATKRDLTQKDLLAPTNQRLSSPEISKQLLDLWEKDIQSKLKIYDFNQARVDVASQKETLQSDITTKTNSAEFKLSTVESQVQIQIPLLQKLLKFLEEQAPSEKARIAYEVSSGQLLPTQGESKNKQLEAEIADLKIQLALLKPSLKEAQRADLVSRENALAIVQQTRMNTYDFQSKSPSSQAFERGQMGQSSLQVGVRNHEVVMSDIGERLSKNQLTKDQADEQFAQQRDHLSQLKQASEEYVNYWKGEVTSAVQQPLKTMLLDWNQAENSMKQIGMNILGSIADNITSSLTKGITDMLFAAETKAAAMQAISWISGGFFSSGGSVPGYASGGDTSLNPQFINSTQRIRGAGTGLSDSIHAVVPKGSYVLNAETSKRVKLSNGEIVIDPKTVNKIGKHKLDKINFGGNYASGGSVGESEFINNRQTRPDRSPNQVTQKQGDTFNVSITMQSSGDPAKDGELAATSFIEKVAQVTATKTVTRMMSTHIKQQHKKG